MASSIRGALFGLVCAIGVSACAHASDDAIGPGGGAATGTSASSTSAGIGGAGGTSTTGSTASSGMGGAGATSTDAATTSTTGNTSTSTTTGGGPGAVFFSEYVEGTGNNKALEIVNTTASSVALGDCTIDRYQNGSATAAAPVITLDAVSLGPGQVFVLCNSSFSMTSLCDQTDANVSHTGNDAVVLTCNGTVKDAFGVVGQDMVWGTAPTTSQDATLRRKCAVGAGDTNTADAFDPADEWESFAADTVADLGQHNCP